MAKKNDDRSITEIQGLPPTDDPALNESMESFLKESGLADEYAAGERATLNIWEPKFAEIRAIRYMGMETKESTKGDFKGSEFDIHYGVDLKTGEDFSFIGGGLFTFTVKDRKIEKGEPLLVRFLGIIPIDDGRRQAKQWEIRRLSKK